MSSSEGGRYNISLAALLIGVPVLVGASCYYLYFGNGSNKNKKKPSSSSKSGDNANKKLSPLEQVMHLKQIGNQNFSRKNYDIAIEHYTKALELSNDLTPNLMADDLAIFYQNRAACNEALSNYELVIQDCDRAIELRKNYTKAYLRRAKAYEKLEKYDKAMVDAYCANLLEKFQNQASMILTESIVKASSKTKAMEAMKKHKLDWPSNQTIKAYFSAFTLDPVKDKVGGEIRTSAQLQPIYDEANRSENDNDPLSLLIRGSCLSVMGAMELAQAVFDQLLSISDSDCSSRIKANALIKKSAIVISDPTSPTVSLEKDLEQVFELHEQAIKLDPENPDIYLHKAQALTLSEKLTEAIEALDKAIELKKDFHSAIAQKFYIEFKISMSISHSNSKMQELLESFKAIVKENPNAQDIQQMYAQVLTELSYFEAADQVLINLTKLDPTDGSVYISRALLQFHLKSDPDEVATLIQEALKIDPKIIFAYEILGSIETQRGKSDEAIKIFETALKYCQSEAEYSRCYSLLDSAICQRAAAELLNMSV